MPGDGTLAEFWSIERLEPTTVTIDSDWEGLHCDGASVD